MTASAPRASPFYFKHGLILATVACLLYFVGRARCPGEWDSFDYLKQIATHRLSDLGFGRPFFIGYNIVLWETTRKIFGLAPPQVESVVLCGILILGAAAVLVFSNFARHVVPPRATTMAALGFMLSPLYAFYSGYVMTEVPMLLLLLAAAMVLWDPDGKGGPWRDIVAGLLYGLAFGVREQALTMAGAFLWILWVRRRGPAARLYSLYRFALSFVAVALSPILLLYLQDPAAFLRRIETWLRAIPRGGVHFWKNVQASLLYAFLSCPAAWLSMLGAGGYRLTRGRAEKPGSMLSAAAGSQTGPSAPGSNKTSVAVPLWGFLCCFALPLVVLWRDADVQIHPRYLLILLPASVVFCATLYHRWAAVPRAALVWTLLHVLVFGLAQVVIQPLSLLLCEKKEFALLVREKVPGDALLVAGAYSPAFDYYRALGERPRWSILWSGWGWSRERAAAAISEALLRNEPVYLCDGPYAWLFFEDERLDLHYILLRYRKETVAPGLLRIER